MKYLLIFILILKISKLWSFNYALPGDISWPKLSDFVDLETKIIGKIFIRGDNDYKPHTWNKITSIPKPAVIIQPITNNDIIEALKFSKKFNLRISVQSTGHHQDHRNILDNSVHIDMSSMNHKRINLQDKTVTLGPGNNFTQILKFVEEQSNKSLVVASGADPGVGIYGWTTGGGHGPFTKQYGLGVDNLVSIDLILADYSIVTVSENINPEIFRAIRGSGGSTYGIAVSLTVRLHPSLGKMSVFTGVFELNASTVDLISDWIINAPDYAYSYLITNNFGSFKLTTFSAFCLNDEENCQNLLEKLRTGCIPTPEIKVTCNPLYNLFDSYYEYFKTVQSERGAATYLSSTALNSSNIKNGLKEILEFINTTPYTGCSGNAVLGGASSKMDPNSEKTSISKEMRNGLMAITCYSMMEESTPIDDKKYQVKVMDDFAEKILKKYSNWVYWNEPQHNFPKNDWKERYWGGIENYNKLLDIKIKLDPDNLFTCYHCVGYERKFNEMPSVCPENKCTCSNTPNGVCATVNNIRCWSNSTFYSDQCNSQNQEPKHFLTKILQIIITFFKSLFNNIF
ncbi:unnamed protein product [Brachionus calyciflorus]|uniref:FAD-binding PCMH-type domain-containing protein n=1 Tax=Brachionus calyciflorus TaxID=104777 RepID=A0A813MKI5_9BILA|nr:unnamed protein product [Brachionus calyciflorus]